MILSLPVTASLIRLSNPRQHQLMEMLFINLQEYSPRLIF